MREPSNPRNEVPVRHARRYPQSTRANIPGVQVGKAENGRRTQATGNASSPYRQQAKTVRKEPSNARPSTHNNSQTVHAGRKNIPAPSGRREQTVVTHANSENRQQAPYPARREAVRRIPPAQANGQRALTQIEPKRTFREKWSHFWGDVKPVTPQMAEKKEHARREEEAWQQETVRIRGGVDKVMLALILVLLCLGTITIFSASYPWALAKGKEDALYYGKRQLLFVALGLIAMVAAYLVPLPFWRNKYIAFGIYGGVLVLLVLVLVLGVAKGEAQRWIPIPGLPLTIQPSELMKFAIVVIEAWYISTYKKVLEEKLNRRQIFLYHAFFPAILFGVACFLVLLEKHLSGTIIIFAIAWFTMLAGGCSFKWTACTYIPVGLAAAGLYLLKNPYALKRINTKLDENANILDELYQTNQGLYAIGSGGLFGVGFGQSRQKYSYVSEAHTDFIFTIWCEEMGFVGAVALVLLFLAFVWRGYTIASRAPDTFSALVAFGITTHVGIQALMNMCVVTDLMINTGVPLPFFTYGGSALLELMVEMGVLLRISKQYYQKRDEYVLQYRANKLGLE